MVRSPCDVLFSLGVRRGVCKSARHGGEGMKKETGDSPIKSANDEVGWTALRLVVFLIWIPCRNLP